MSASQSEIENNNQTLYSADKPPSSFIEASARRTFLTNKINDIQLQIQNRDLEYRQWRDKAVLALAYAQREVAFIKGWVREKTDMVMLSDSEISETDHDSLLREAYKTLRKVAARDENQLRPDDHVLIKAIERKII